MELSTKLELNKSTKLELSLCKFAYYAKRRYICDMENRRIITTEELRNGYYYQIELIELKLKELDHDQYGKPLCIKGAKLMDQINSLETKISATWQNQ